MIGEIKKKKGANYMSWDKLCAMKEDGGMEFRNVFAFNLIMLGKEGWRIFFDPKDLSSWVLKAKYCPNGDFLEASLGHNPSFT